MLSEEPYTVNAFEESKHDVCTVGVTPLPTANEK